MIALPRRTERHRLWLFTKPDCRRCLHHSDYRPYPRRCQSAAASSPLEFGTFGAIFRSATVPVVATDYPVASSIDPDHRPAMRYRCSLGPTRTHRHRRRASWHDFGYLRPPLLSLLPPTCSPLPPTCSPSKTPSPLTFVAVHRATIAGFLSSHSPALGVMSDPIVGSVL